MKARRITCELLGCVCAENYPACDRCGADLYEDFIELGRLEPMFGIYGRARRIVLKVTGSRCQVCSRRFWGRDGWTCSDKCFSDWLPF